jgi:Carboxypeptidase regulatory-like domain
VVKLVCILTVAAASAAAQTVQGEVTGEVIGEVTNVATGGGIGGAKVVLQQGERAVYSANTDAEGHFRIEGVKDGAYSARYSADRYFYPGSGPREAPPFQVGAGGVPVRIEGRMIPLSRISGRVIDTRGDPVAKARVELTTSSAFWKAETDAMGNFELDSVFPVSNHTLSAAPPLDRKPPGPDPDTGQARAWTRTFYPGVAFREQAAPIELRVGGDLQGLEVKLLALPVQAVYGVLLSPDGAPVPKVAVALWETGPRRDAAYRAESKPDGTFEFPAVVDGDWRLSAKVESGGVELLADEWIAMKGREIGGVKLRLSSPFTVSGRVIFETRQGMPSPDPPEVLLIKQHDGQILFEFPGMLSARPGRDGRFRFGNLYPGTYRIVPGAPPPLFYADAMHLGEAPVLDEVELSAGSPELTIVYKTNGGTVRGTVEKCGTGQVWLVSQDARSRGYFAGACDGAPVGPSRFEIAAVPPGEYYALAVPGYELWPGNVDAAFLQRATRVTVRAGETTQAALALSTMR